MQILFIFGINNTFTWLKIQKIQKGIHCREPRDQLPVPGAFLPAPPALVAGILKKRQAHQSKGVRSLRISSPALLLP